MYISVIFIYNLSKNGTIHSCPTNARRVTDVSKRCIWFDFVGFVLILCNNSRLFTLLHEMYLFLSAFYALLAFRVMISIFSIVMLQEYTYLIHWAASIANVTLQLNNKHCFRAHLKPYTPIKGYAMSIKIIAVNSMLFKNAIWRHKTWSTLVRGMACRLLGAKSLPETTDP